MSKENKTSLLNDAYFKVVKDTVYQSIKEFCLPVNQIQSNEKPMFTDTVEISVVVKGSGIHRILNEDTVCGVGDMYIIHNSVHHSYFATENGEKPTVCTVLFNAQNWFDGEWADSNSSHFCCGVFRDNIPVSYAMLTNEAVKSFMEIFNSIKQEQESRNIEWQVAVKSYLALMLVLISRYINMATTATHKHPKEWVTVSAAINEIENRYADSSMTLESIASNLFISKSQLSKLFQKVTGESFLDYVRRVRISRACGLLINTDMTNEEIIVKCGLKDIPSFYKLFKAQTGMTPYQYRTVKNSKNMNKEEEKKMSILEDISQSLQKGKVKLVKELVEQAVDEGIPADDILNNALLKGMGIIGERFKNNEVYVPEVLVAARAMNTGAMLLKPLLSADTVQAKGKVCIGTVKGDLHDIGKNLVKMMMEGKGLEVIDLGVDVPPEKFISTAIEENCKIICCSALLTTTMPVMQDVVNQAASAGIRDRIKIMIGGAPVTQDYCDKIGADCYTTDAASAADAAVAICSQ